MKHFPAFANESIQIVIDQLKIENRLDRVSVYGSLDITKDQVGLDRALALQAVLAATVAALQAQELPAVLPAPEVHTIRNPFS
jgi:hypothetical protein